MGNGTFALSGVDFSDGQFWSYSLANNIFGQYTTRLNSVDRNNFNQLKADLLPTGYTYDDDGAANLTNPIWNKQTATQTYQANIALGTSTDADWTTVDGTNAVLTFTPEYAGKYRVDCMFSVNVVASGGAAISIVEQFRLITGSTGSVGQVVAFAPIGNDASATFPVHLSFIYTLTAVSTTFTLQKRITTATNVGTNNIIGSSDNYGLYMMVEKI